MTYILKLSKSAVNYNTCYSWAHFKDAWHHHFFCETFQMNIHSLRLLQTELQSCIHDKKNYLGSGLRRGFQIQHAQVTGITIRPWIISVGNVDYDPWTCEMILGTAYQYIPFPQCAEKISSPPVKPLGVELNKLDYPLMSAYSVMNTGTRTPPALCHSHYSYTGQSYFDINLVGDGESIWFSHQNQG